jgi:hypothetical protein
MIKPTVGRVVWFWPASTTPKGTPDAQPLAATIAYVHSDTMVNLTVHDRDGETYGLTSVKLWHGEGESPDMPHAEWMPYQKGQAAKTEAIEKQIGAGG